MGSNSEQSQEAIIFNSDQKRLKLVLYVSSCPFTRKPRQQYAKKTSFE